MGQRERIHQPNIILVVADQHRADFLACAGNAQLHTPNFDRMAQRGQRYSHCVSAAPMCMPYRCSLQTGVYPFQHGAVDNKGHLELDCLEGPLLAELFKEAGYQTAYFGKCHWNRDVVNGDGEFVPRERRLGWQHWEGWNNGHSSYDMPAFNDQGEREHPWLGRYEPEIMTDRAMRYMSEVREMEKPFLIQMNWHPPHNATVVKEFSGTEDALSQARALNDQFGLGLPEEAFSSYWWFCQSFPLSLMYPVVPQRSLNLYDPNDFQAPANINKRYTGCYGWHLREYAAMVSSLDEQMGRLQYYLEVTGLSRNTVVIYTSDHGDNLGTQQGLVPFRGKGSSAAESVRVPMLIEGPGVPRPSDVDERPCNTMDLYATLLDLGGIPPKVRLKGRSLIAPATRNYCFGAVTRGRSVFDGEWIYSIDCEKSGKWGRPYLRNAGLPASSVDTVISFNSQNATHRKLHADLMQLLSEEGELVEFSEALGL